MPYKDSEKQREYQRKWMRSRREAFLADKTCAYCAGTDRLEIHHFDPAVKVAHRIWSWTKSKRAAELAKCVVLCRNCHIGHHRSHREQFCQRGHEFTEENTYVQPTRGTRECRTCRAARRAA